MRIGIIGTGSMGQSHAAAWAHTPAVLAGFLAQHTNSASRAAKKWGGHAYEEMAELLGDVDLVDICAPTHLHYELVLAAAGAGKHVVCEKPLARTVAQAQAMLAACRAAGVKLFVAHVVRYFPAYALAQAEIAAGTVGALATLRLKRSTAGPQSLKSWFRNDAKSGGLIVDLMIHDFDFARWVAGPVVQVFAQQVEQATEGVSQQYGQVSLTHQSGAVSVVAGAWGFPPPHFHTQFAVSGSTGRLNYDSETGPEVYHRAYPSDQPAVMVPSEAAEPYAAQLSDFYQAAIYDRQPRVAAEDGLAALQIALAARDSARSGRAVALPALPE